MADSGFTTPTLSEVVQRVHDDIDARLPGGDSRIRRRATRAIALGLGGASWLLHRFALAITNEILPDLASATGVRRWRKLWGLPDVPSVRSQGPTQFSGVPATVIPLGTSVVRADGTEYLTTVGGVIPGGGTVDINVQAVIAGEAGDAAAGVSLYLSAPIVGCNTETTVQAPGIAGGEDDETTESERDRVLDRMATPPQGGAVADFIQWTKEAVANTREVYVSPNTPVFGEVTVRFIVEPGDGDPANAMPSAGELTAARNYIRGSVGAVPFDYADAAAPAPLIGDRVTIPALSTQAIALTIATLDPFGDATVQAAIEASVKSMLLNEGAPGQTVKVSQIWTAIGSAAGEISFDPATSLINALPPADVAMATADHFPILTTPIVWIP
jgi:uncharacterized phage protein gp47/JayE